MKDNIKIAVVSLIIIIIVVIVSSLIKSHMFEKCINMPPNIAYQNDVCKRILGDYLLTE